MTERLLKVSSTTDARMLSRSIITIHHSFTGKENEDCRIVLRAIGPSAISQAVKAIAISNGELAPQGKMYALVPSFKSVPNPKTTNEKDKNLVAIDLALKLTNL